MDAMTNDDEPLPEGTFTVTIRFVPSEGWYSVEMLDHPGVFSQGDKSLGMRRILALSSTTPWKGMDEI